MLVLSKGLHEQIAAHGAVSYPYEGCGLLLGIMENGRNVAIEVRPLPNVWPVESEKPERFAIHPDDWARVEFEAAEAGLDVIGVFHSHPDHPPIASPRDLAWSAWRLDGYSFLITQVVAGGAGLSRSWRLSNDNDSFVEEELQIEE
jgi:proteasome lid subunit RPN8/RPN11